MQNKEKAYIILKAKLYQVELDKQKAEQKDLR
jgi:protein subunit release factor A